MRSKDKERRICVDNQQLINQTILFSPDDVHYLRNVLHMKLGGRLTVLDGFNSYEVVLELGTSREWVGTILGVLNQAQSFPINISLAFGCLRPGPTEEIIRHGSELGVEEFFPLILELSNRRPEVARTRWVNVAESACAQSGRIKRPQIHAPSLLSTFLETHSSNSKLIHLAMEAKTPPLLKVLDYLSTNSVIFVTGSEGGITQQEETLLLHSCSVPASLGSTTLRAETAAIVAVGIAMNWALCRFSQ